MPVKASRAHEGTLTTSALWPLSQVALDLMLFLPPPSWCSHGRLVPLLLTIKVNFNEGRDPPLVLSGCDFVRGVFVPRESTGRKEQRLPWVEFCLRT